MVDIVVGDVSDEFKQQFKKQIPTDPTKTMGLYSVVYVAICFEYDLTTNVSVTDSMTNGAECIIIQKIDY